MLTLCISCNKQTSGGALCDSCSPNCSKCHDEHYILGGCCGGQECGCMGQPVSMSNCDQCNLDESKSMGDYVRQYAERVEYLPVTALSK